MIQVKRVLVKQRKRKDGTYPVQIRITGDRLSNYISTEVGVSEDQWDVNEMMVVRNPKQEELNKIIMDAYMNVYDLALEDKLKNLNQTSAQLKKRYLKWEAIKDDVKLKQEQARKNGEPVPKISIAEHINRAEEDDRLEQTNKISGRFFVYAQHYLDELKSSGKFSRYSSEQPRFEVMKDFAKDLGLRFESVTPSFLRDLACYLKTERKVGDRTVMNYYVCIRTLFNRAIAENIIDANRYPFGKGKIKIRMPEANKIGLTESELRELENLKLKKGTPEWHALNIWLLSFYFAGIRVSDTVRLRWSDFLDGRIYYVMGKNQKKVSLKIPDQVQKILNKYEPLRDDFQGYVFPYLEKADLKNPHDIFVKARSANGLINTELRGIAKRLNINKKMSMHISRHSFGNISGDKISPQMLQKLYRHSSITTTMGYQSNFIHKDADDALDTVLNF